MSSRRLSIAIDVASALDYLHQHRPLPVIHCDLKPSNILLDNNMVAHVGDFGLARALHQDQSDLLEKSSGWATMRGTVGYAAPGIFQAFSHFNPFLYCNFPPKYQKYTII